MAERHKGWRGGCLRRLAALGFLWGVGLAVLGVVALAAAALAYDHYVVRNPGPHLGRDHVRTIIAQESPVYYRDGTTRIGVFFEAEHREFVPFEDLPRAYVMGIVAAEDGAFWAHAGVNLKGIARAMRDNLAAGGLVAGGSTLTQQTAKNLYYRPDRSVRSKGVELLNALRLEAHYEKSEILEFYANQFHVSGNGRGLGIAARHFFDEEVEDLTVAECAFLAGLVKAPSRYDPFLGDEARRGRALVAAHDRTRYVLKRILDEPIENLAGPLPGGRAQQRAAHEARLREAGRVRAEAERLLADGFELPFKRGSFRYESSAVLDEVARRLGEPPFDQILGDAGVDDAETAGLVVVTTLDPDAQREATWALWHHLTEVGTWMEALGPQDYVLEGHRGPRFDPDHPPRPHEFRVARLVERVGEPGKRTLRLDLGGHECLVDRDGAVRVAVATVRGNKKDSRAKAASKEVDAWLDALPDQAVLLASVRDVPASGPALCDLEVRPELQGAITVLQGGQVRAMVGGNDNRNFNRATALRQFGSTWKPLVFHAALQLGWSPNDVLDNTRHVFPFSTTFYYPRPDHTPAPRVSMSWAGVNSENLASIWLLYHLTDRLDGEQIRALAVSLDLARRADESETDYRARIQKAGVLPTRDRIEEGLFLQSRQELLAGIDASSHPEDAVALQSLLFGWGYATERNRVSREGAKSRAWKLRALDNDFRSMSAKLPGCRSQYGALGDALEARRAPDLAVVDELSVLLDGDSIRVACGALPEGYVLPDADFVASVPYPPGSEQTRNDDAPVFEAIRPQRPKRWGRFGGRDPESDTLAPEPSGGGPAGPSLAPIGDMLVDDRLHLSTIEALGAALERRKLAWDLQPEHPDLYDPEVLYWHQDFRVLLSMRFVAALAQQYGVQTDIREVLAMPLGASEITLEEAASLYTGLVAGTAWEFPGISRGRVVDAVPTSTLLIQEIRDVDGRILYRAAPKPTAVVESTVAEMTADILSNVVLHGTGRRAQGTVRHGGRGLPVGGKTGTTNDYRNAAFLGFVPVATPLGYDVANGFVVGAYVGYDDNRAMSRGNIRLAGASGALPAWMGAAQGLADHGLLGEAPSVVLEEGAWPLLRGSGLALEDVDPATGLAPAPGGDVATTLVLESRVTRAPELDFHLIDRPVRVAPGTDQALEGRAIRPAPAPTPADTGLPEGRL